MHGPEQATSWPAFNLDCPTDQEQTVRLISVSWTACMMPCTGHFMYWISCVGEDTPSLIVIQTSGTLDQGISWIHTHTCCRHFWLQTKLESNELDRSDGHNQFYKFIPLKPVLTTETQQIADNPEQYVQDQGFSYQIDGLLFYHRQAHYRGGSTPLVCWVPRDEIQNMLK